MNSEHRWKRVLRKGLHLRWRGRFPFNSRSVNHVIGVQKPPLAFRIVRVFVHPNIFEFDQKSFANGEACILAQILPQSEFSPANLEKNNAFPRQIRRGRAHKDRAFVLFTNHGGRQESSGLFALVRIPTFYSLRGFFEHLDIERLEARIAQQFISSATMAATSSTPSLR